MYTLILVFSLSLSAQHGALASEKVEGFQSFDTCEIAGRKAERDLVHSPNARWAKETPIIVKYSCVKVK